MPHARTMTLLLGLLAGGAEAQNFTVYHDALDAAWANWSWGTNLDFANGNPVYGGSGHSIRATFTQGWAGVFLHTDSPVSSADCTGVRFALHGGSSGGQALRLWVYDAGFSASPNDVPLSPAAGTWQIVEVTFAQLGVETIGGLIWQDASGGPQPSFYLDEIAFVAGPPPPAPALSIEAAQDRHPISPQIYGLNFASPELLAELRIPVHRWGGNATTRYNWMNDTSNRASDWFFENIPNENPHPELLPDGSSSDRFHEDNLAAGADTLLTVPLIGWTPKARAFEAGFRVSRYGPQQAVDPWQPDAGNGVRPDGTLITGNDPNDTSTAIGPAFVQSWIAHLVSRYGPAGGGGVRYYNLDNEPMLWNSTHRDVHPAGCGYDELRDRTVQYAAAVKAADAGALTLGPVFWGWTAYFYSALDIELGGPEWWNTRPDRIAHGDIPLVEWYLQQLRAYELSTGVRILDYLDLHYYPQAAGVALQPAGDAATQARRLRSTRSLWDPGYVDESWIGEPVRLIPRMRAWVAENYPGTRLAISEYNWGAFESINGALAQADVLGIFAREQLDLATLWTAPDPDQPVAHALRLYRNYDGAGSGFGETWVRSQSTDQARVAIYAALREDGALTAVLVNKSAQAQVCPLTVADFAAGARAEVYRYSAANLSAIQRLPDVEFSAAAPGQALTPPGGSLDLPASSLTLLVLRGDGRVGDLNCDGVVGFSDINAFVLYLSNFAAWQAAYPGCPAANGDINGDGSYPSFGDINPFVTLLTGG